MKRCPFCAEEIQDEALVCKHCGRDLVGGASQVPIVQPKKKTGCVAFGCAGLLVLVVAVWVLVAIGQHLTKTPPPSPTPALTKEQLEARARAVETGRKRNVAAGIVAAQKVTADTRLCHTPESITGAWQNLRLVQKQDAEWQTALALSKKLEGCRQIMMSQAATAARGVMLGQRQEWSRRLEKVFLDQGINADVRLGGPAKDQLTIKWALMSKATVYKLTSDGSLAEGSLLGQASALGITKVRFEDGFDFGTWYRLTPLNSKDVAAKVLAEQGLGEPLVLK